MSETQPKPQDLAARLFENTRFQFSWILVLGALFVFVGVPFQKFLIVLWVRGSDAYFHQGIRVLRVKPARFSDGELVPQWINFTTGMAIFLIVSVGLSLLLVRALRFYERRFKK